MEYVRRNNDAASVEFIAVNGVHVCVCVLSINIQYTKYTLFVRNDYILISDQFAVVYIRTSLLKSIRLSLHTFRFT